METLVTAFGNLDNAMEMLKKWRQLASNEF